MAYIKKNYKDIMDAKNRGDKKAIAIFKALCDGCPQNQLDDMVENFLNPIPDETPAVMPKDTFTQFGAGSITAQPQALKQPVQKSFVQTPQEAHMTKGSYMKGTVFHGDADEYAPGFAPERFTGDDNSNEFDQVYFNDKQNLKNDEEDYIEEEDVEEENVYDDNTIDKVISLFKDRNLSPRDIETLLKGMKSGK